MSELNLNGIPSCILCIVYLPHPFYLLHMHRVGILVKHHHFHSAIASQMPQTKLGTLVSGLCKAAHPSHMFYRAISLGSGSLSRLKTCTAYAPRALPGHISYPWQKVPKWWRQIAAIREIRIRWHDKNFRKVMGNFKMDFNQFCCQFNGKVSKQAFKVSFCWGYKASTLLPENLGQ